MDKKVCWWEYTKEYVYGSHENVFTRKNLLNFFFENDIVRRKEEELLDKNLIILIGPHYIVTEYTIKVGFYVTTGG